MDEIESLDTRNPRLFWDKIKNINPRKNNLTIPCNVRLADGTLSDKPEDVVGEWHDAFKGLCNPTETETESEQFE